MRPVLAGALLLASSFTTSGALQFIVPPYVLAARPVKIVSSTTYANALRAYNKGAYQSVLNLLSKAQTADDFILLARTEQVLNLGDGENNYKRAAQIAGRTPRKRMLIAIGMINRKDYDDAEILLGNAHAQAPNDIEIASTFGRCLYKMGSTDKGLALMEKSLAAKPKSIICLENLAFTFSETFESKKALVYLTRLVAAQPNCVTPLLQRAFIYSESGRIKEALADFTAILKINPDCQQAYYKRATIYRNQKQYEKALADSNKCIACKDSSSVIVRRCMRIKVEAEEHLNLFASAAVNAKTLNSTHGDGTKFSWAMRGDMLKQASLLERAGKYKEALAAIEPMNRLTPNKTEVMVFRARVLGEAGNFKDSLFICNKLIALDSNMADWYFMRAKAFDGLGNKAAAAQDKAKAKVLGEEYKSLPQHFQDSIR